MACQVLILIDYLLVAIAVWRFDIRLGLVSQVEAVQSSRGGIIMQSGCTDVLLYHFLTPCITPLHKRPESKFGVNKTRLQCITSSCLLAASHSPSTLKREKMQWENSNKWLMLFASNSFQISMTLTIQVPVVLEVFDKSSDI